MQSEVPQNYTKVCFNAELGTQFKPQTNHIFLK